MVCAMFSTCFYFSFQNFISEIMMKYIRFNCSSLIIVIRRYVVVTNVKKNLANLENIRKYVEDSNLTNELPTENANLVNEFPTENSLNLQTKNAPLVDRAKRNFLEFVRQRDLCSKRVEHFYRFNNKLNQDLINIAKRDWNNMIYFSRYQAVGVVKSLFRLFLDFDDDEKFEKLIDKRYLIDSIVYFYSYSVNYFSNTELVTLFCAMALIKERKNIFYPELTRLVIDELFRRALICSNFRTFVLIFETMHRFGDDLFDREIKFYANLMNLKSIEMFFADNDFETNDYGTIFYSLTLLDRRENEAVIENFIKNINETLISIENVNTIGYICYFLNWYKDFARLPHLGDNFKVYLHRLINAEWESNNNRIFVVDSPKCSDFTKECIKKLLENN